MMFYDWWAEQTRWGSPGEAYSLARAAWDAATAGAGRRWAYLLLDLRHRAAPDGSPEEQTLAAELARLWDGLSEEDRGEVRRASSAVNALVRAERLSATAAERGRCEEICIRIAHQNADRADDPLRRQYSITVAEADLATAVEVRDAALLIREGRPV